MNSTNTNKVKSPRFKDISRFTRWVNHLDGMDEGLSPVKRKTKWFFFLGFLFLFFALSFVLFPTVKFNNEKLNNPGLDLEQQPAVQQSTTSPFEMQTDSFENLLKRQIYENDLHVPEKK